MFTTDDIYYLINLSAFSLATYTGGQLAIEYKLKKDGYKVAKVKFKEKAIRVATDTFNLLLPAFNLKLAFEKVEHATFFYDDYKENGIKEGKIVPIEENLVKIKKSE